MIIYFKFKIVHFIKAAQMASGLENTWDVDVVLGGAFSTLQDIDEEIWLTYLLSCLLTRLRELNENAFTIRQRDIRDSNAIFS